MLCQEWEAFHVCCPQESRVTCASRAQVRHSDTGDALWVARSKTSPGEVWALDFVVERKGVHDLVGSIKQGRYEKQKYVLRRCGLRRVMYLVEGLPEIEVQGVRAPLSPLE